MRHPAVLALVDDEFLVDYGLLGNPRALQSALARSRQVSRIRDALANGEIDEDALRLFVGELLRELKIGTLFPYDVSLAALAVAIQSRPTAFAEEFLRSLAALKLVEMPMSIRVAREAMKVNQRLPKNKFARFTVTPRDTTGNLEWSCFQPFREPMIAESHRDFAYGGGNA